MHLRDDTETLPVAVPRQRSAFPPNFVHSLDSTHMLLTAIEMDKANVPFAAVHDSYWVHAGNIDQMNEQLRQVCVWCACFDWWVCTECVVRSLECAAYAVALPVPPPSFWVHAV